MSEWLNFTGFLILFYPGGHTLSAEQKLALLEEREETEHAEPPEATPEQVAVLAKIFKLSLDDFAKSENYVPKLTAAFPKPKNSDVGPVPELNDYMKAGLLPRQEKDFSPDWETELRSIQSFVLHTAYALGMLPMN
jgi:hypothetical protein